MSSPNLFPKLSDFCKGIKPSYSCPLKAGTNVVYQIRLRIPNNIPPIPGFEDLVSRSKYSQIKLHLMRQGEYPNTD